MSIQQAFSIFKLIGSAWLVAARFDLIPLFIYIIPLRYVLLFMYFVCVYVWVCA